MSDTYDDNQAELAEVIGKVAGASMVTHIARRERAAGVRALREAAADLYGDERAKGAHAHPLSVAAWLKARADRIERTQP